MRLKINITGVVQGVGFRPFIYRLAKEIGLNGYVCNDAGGVVVEVEGKEPLLTDFLLRIEKEKPALSRIYGMHHSFLHDKGFNEFVIKESEREGEIRVSVLPDIATCDECLRDVSDRDDRRFAYPFTNCTNCGPRFTIIKDLPYDRKNTSMKNFRMCSDCESEYGDHSDRRFHAQPDACPVCGPEVSLFDNKGKAVSSKDEAIEQCVALINEGNIIAIKGLGGYHLLCDAWNAESITKLREKKQREERPVAVMFPGIGSIKAEAHVSILEERALFSVERPIVILRKKKGARLPDSISPGNDTIGAFLPYTPLHHIILQKLKRPVVATSANISDEPIAKDEDDAFKRLSGIADYFLIHDRKIIRRCDDSIVRIIADRQMPIRRSRGFAPLPVILPFKLKKPVLALGSYLNNTIAVGIDDKVYLSQHIGDLETPRAMEFYEETVNDFLMLFNIKPEVVVADMHPRYFSTIFGEKHYKDKLVKVQHHFAHILSCMAENDIQKDEEVIGFAFDGTGYGTDKTVWGSEVLIASYSGFKRLYHLHPYRLPGGEKAVKEPFRTALSLLYETFEDSSGFDLLSLSEQEKKFYLDMIRKGVNSPLTTSMGRLFDGVASIVGLKHHVSYHAQAAVMLEQAASRSDEDGGYLFSINEGIIDFRPMIREIVKDKQSGVSTDAIAKIFHNTIIEIIISLAESLRNETGINKVALSGGVFQNAILLSGAFNKLKEKGFTPLIHQLVPSNDGGISLGQVVAVHFQ
ncbi:MAG: carbamoyltransferase HypF [Thermodesulfovibrionia bacterium]|nr:carbamoyltransferase HypF [Thermodesulfovibrionia bacterium]